MKKLLHLLTLCFLFHVTSASAQCNFPVIPVTVFDGPVPIMCDGIDGTCNVLPPQYTLMPLPGCDFGAYYIHNSHLIGFVAGSTTLVLEIIPSNCFPTSGQLPGGIQAAIYEEHPLDGNPYPVLAFECGNGFVQPIIIQTQQLCVGETYILLVDGWNGDICDYEINVLSGSTEAIDISNEIPIIIGPDSACEGETITMNAQIGMCSDFYWSVNGDGNIIDYDDGNIVLEIGEGPSLEVCVYASNECFMTVETCTTITVDEPMIGDSISTTVNICEGDCYNFNGQLLCDEGVYMDSVLTNDCIVNLETVTITFLDAFHSEESIMICEGDCYNWYGTDYCLAGIYETTFTAVNGCDSIETIILEVLPPTVTTLNVELCPDEGYQIDTIIYSAPGSYTIPFVDQMGCDSILELNLTLAPPTYTTIGTSICFGQSFCYNNNYYTNSGAYLDSMYDVNGCLTYVTINVRVILPVLTLIDTTICEGDTVLVGGEIVTTSDTIIAAYPAANGCDSVVVAAIEVLPSAMTILDIELEPGELYEGVEYETDTILYDSLMATNGCDSIVITNITIIDPLSVKQLEPGAYLVYPNPANQYLILEFKNPPAQGANLKVFNIAGKQLYNVKGINTTTTRVDLSLWPNGTYILQWANDQEMLVEKFVISR